MNSFIAFQLQLVIDDMVKEFVDAAYSKGHRKNLTIYSAKYQQFCDLLNIVPFPATEDNMARYIAYLTLTLRSPKSIQNYISAVKKLHEFARIPVPIYSGYLDIILDGVERVLHHVVVQAPPITPDMLRMMAKLIDVRNSRSIVIFTAILTAFYLFLRSSNYVAKSASKFDGSRQLTRGDLVISKQLILVNIKWSKTNQLGKKKLLLPLIKIPGSSICPITWIRYMIQRVPAPSNAPLFCLPQKNGLTPLTYSQLNTQLKTWISDIGLNGHRYSSHGIRRGGATWANKVNISSLAIKNWGDWASSAYELYIQNDLENRLKALIAFSKDL